MPLDDLREMPGHLIRRAQQISSSFFVEETRSTDLTPVQYASLIAIREHPGIDATSLSNLIAFDRATIGGVVERLETKDLVRREPSNEDKRIKRLYLTPSGLQALDGLEHSVEKVQERLLSAFDDTERALFMRLLRQLVETHNPSLPASVQVTTLPFREKAGRAVARRTKAAGTTAP